MKDQLRLLRDCINNDRPAVVFQETIFALLRSWRQQKKFIVNMVVPKNFFLTGSCLSMR